MSKIQKFYNFRFTSTAMLQTHNNSLHIENCYSFPRKEEFLDKFKKFDEFIHVCRKCCNYLELLTFYDHRAIHGKRCNMQYAFTVDSFGNLRNMANPLYVIYTSKNLIFCIKEKKN